MPLTANQRDKSVPNLSPTRRGEYFKRDRDTKDLGVTVSTISHRAITSTTLSTRCLLKQPCFDGYFKLASNCTRSDHNCKLQLNLAYCNRYKYSFFRENSFVSGTRLASKRCRGRQNWIVV